MKLCVPRFGCGSFWRAKSGRRWIWEALTRLDVGAPIVFVSSDFQHVNWRKTMKIRSDTCFTAAFFFVSAEAHGFVRALGNFCRLQPVGGQALIRLDVGI